MVLRVGHLARAGALLAVTGIAGLGSGCSGAQVGGQQEPKQAQERQPAQTRPPATARSDDRGLAGGPAEGNFSLVMMVHTKSKQYGNLPGVRPFGAEASEGAFTYRSIACQGNAPVNNISSDLPSYNARLAGSRVPSSLRAHPFAFRVREEGDERTMEGEITLTVCKLGPGPTPKNEPVRDEDKPKIRVAFDADLGRGNAEAVPFDGSFRLRGGTQRYEDLEGSGEIAGYLFCFAPEGCAAKGGKYLDGQFVMHGRYEDPNPTPERR